MRAGPTPKHSLRIVLFYAAFGVAWIFGSDRLAALLASDAATLAQLHLLKGWAFVGLTAVALYFLIRRQLADAAAAAAAQAAAEAARSHAENQQFLAREAATAAAQRLTVATQAAGLGTWEMDVATRRLQCDSAMHAIYRIAPGERPNTSESWEQPIHPDDRAEVRRRLGAALAGQEDYQVQFRILWPDGQIRHLETRAITLHDSARRPQRLIGVVSDITARVMAERRYRLLAEHTGDVLWIIDLATRRYTYVSPSIRRLRGCEPGDLIGQPLEHGLSPDSLALIRDQLPPRLQAFLAGDPAAVTQTHELEQYRVDGSAVWTELVTTFIRNDQGGVEIIGVTRDISQRHTAQQALKTATARLRYAEELAGTGYWTINLEAGSVDASAGAARIYGLPEAGVYPLGRIQAAAVPEFRPLLDEALRNLVDGRAPYDVSFKVRRLDTGAVVSIHSHAEFDPAARVVFGTIQDITEREHYLSALRNSEAKLRLLVSNAPVVLFQLDRDGRFTMSEGGGLAKIGLLPGEIVGRSVFEVYRDYPILCDRLREALTGCAVHEQVKIGQTWFEYVGNPLRDTAGNVTGLVALAIDISDRKEAEARLRLESAALAAAALAIAITDASGRVAWINPAFTALTGYTAEEAIGRDLGKLVRSGRQPPELYTRLWTTILAGETWRGELVNRRKDGALVPEEQTITPVRDEDGSIAHFIVLKQDIAERRRLQEQVLRAQRLDSVGRLAGGIAHDLNNILAPVLIAPAVLRESITDPEARELLDAIEISANRGAAIIRQLLTFSRGDAAALHQPVQLWHVVRDMVAIIRETFPKNIVTRTDIHSDLWPVDADATQLHQVLMNLCVNSRDAMPEGGTLTISLENVLLDEAAVAAEPGASPGPHVLLGVFDNGKGIAAEHLDKVFDPFFTTKEVGKGTGLGLATVLGIVRGHRGFIQLRSRVGTGTETRIYLPASPVAAPAEIARDATTPPRGRGELVLVVDDEENVRRITSRILEQHGYRVVVAADGAEALARYQQARPTIRLVLTDLLMPFMDGATLIRALHQIDPQVRVLAVSGHSIDDNPLVVGRDVVGFLAKPYLRPALLEAVAGALVEA